jgi:two-component system, NarL family, response regulator NreC
MRTADAIGTEERAGGPLKTAEPLRILLADEQVIVREGVRALLEREGFTVAAETSDGREAVRLATTLQPDIAILDLGIPALNGLDAAREMLRASPGTRSIALTVLAERQFVLDALRAGVKGYVVKTQAAADLVQAIHEVSRGAIYLSPSISGIVVDAYLTLSETPPDPLSPRERQVLQLVAEGRTTREIAELLGVSVKTAESHRMRIMGKLGIRQTAGLVRYAIRQGLIQP